MSKAIYLGIDGKARKMKKAYIGIDGKAWKIKKVYVGVDGKAKLAYTDYVPVESASISWGRVTSSCHTYTNSKDKTRARIYSYVTLYTNITPTNATNKTVTWTHNPGTNGYGNTANYFISDNGNGTCKVTFCHDNDDSASQLACVTDWVYATFSNGDKLGVRIVANSSSVDGWACNIISSISRI